MDIATLQIADIELPQELLRLREIAYDLWWSWSPQAARLFTWIDAVRWKRYHNPVQLLINAGSSTLPFGGSKWAESRSSCSTPTSR